MEKWYRLFRPHLRSTLHLSYPIIIGQLGIILMGVADTVMIGKVGTAPLAAAGISNSIFFLITVLGIGTLNAVAPLVSQAKSANREAGCAHLFKGCMAVAIQLSIVLSLIVTALIIFFQYFKQPPEVTALAKEYLVYITCSTLPLMIFFGAKQFADGLSFTKVSMYATLTGLGINIFLNWIFIYGNWGAPAMGLNGAGLATLLTRVFMTIFILYAILNWAVFKPYLKAFKGQSNGQATREIYRIGLPSGLQLFFEVGAFSGAAIMAGWVSTEALAAHQIAITLAAVTYMAVTGISAAGSIKVGQGYGMGNVTEVLRSGTSALVLTIIFECFTCITFLGFNYFLVSLFNPETEVMHIAAALLIIAAFFQLSDGIQATALGILRGLSDVNLPTAVTLIAYWVVGLPLAYVLSFHYGMGVNGIWIGLLGGLTISAVWLSLRFYSIARNKTTAIYLTQNA